MQVEQPGATGAGMDPGEAQIVKTKGGGKVEEETTIKGGCNQSESGVAEAPTKQIDNIELGQRHTGTEKDEAKESTDGCTSGDGEGSGATLTGEQDDKEAAVRAAFEALSLPERCLSRCAAAFTNVGWGSTDVGWSESHQRMDEDGDGFVSLKDLNDAIGSLSKLHFSPNDVRAMFKYVDGWEGRAGSGKISLDIWERALMVAARTVPPPDRTLEVQIVTVFSHYSAGGVRTAVLTGADAYSRPQMQEAAFRLPYSHVIFVLPARRPDPPSRLYRMLYLTCDGAVKECGHGALAASYCLLENGGFAAGTHVFEIEGGGLLNIRIDSEGGLLSFLQRRLMLHEQLDPEDVSSALNAGLLTLHMDMPTQAVSTGERHCIVPVRSRRVLHSIDPDMDAVSALLRKKKLLALLLVCFEPQAGGDVQVRYLAPITSPMEDAASAAGAAALGAYLYAHGLGPFECIQLEDGLISMGRDEGEWRDVLEIDNRRTFVVEQGYCLGVHARRPSKLHVTMEPDIAPGRGGWKGSAWVGGLCATCGTDLANIEYAGQAGKK